MDPETVETIYYTAYLKRVVIFRKSDGMYGYREEKFFKNDLAQTEGWGVVWLGRSSYDTVETALREIPYNVSWLLPLRDEGKI
jgi:hypothetical protein